MHEQSFKIAVLGAECTGKTSLTQALLGPIQALGNTVEVVPEFLRSWCAQHARTPRAEEQSAIAAQQIHTEQQALLALGQTVSQQAHAVVLCDTAPLITAVYSDLLFDDPSLYPMALAHHSSYALTLVCAIDLPWQADGIQRDGPLERQQFDRRLRCVLDENEVPYALVLGTGPKRSAQALRAILHRLGQSPDAPDTLAGWQRGCEKCSDPACEHRLFSRLI